MDRVKTEFVFVCQEDISLTKPFQLAAIMEAMANDPRLGIVRPGVQMNNGHIQWINKQCGYHHTKQVVKSINGLELMQVDEYSDQNHVSTKSFYEKWVWPRVPDGDFMEHIIGCARHFPGIAGRTWLVGGSLTDDPYCMHEDGRNSA